jgi:dienelactone hydrolase
MYGCSREMRHRPHSSRRRMPVALAALLALSLAGAPSAGAYDSEREQRNFRKLGERYQEEQANPGYQQGQAVTSAGNVASLVQRDAEERDRLSLTLCAAGVSICNRDHRLDDWGEYGVREPVVFVNRNGAHVEGSVWASNATVRDGAPAPAVVIETGSLQAPEAWYRWAAQTLAAHGYVVLTFDVQGQGRSDTFGSGERVFRGVPAQNAEHFVENLQDALDFLLSSPAAPYAPRDPGAAARQADEVAAGDAAAHNPLAAVVDTSRVGAVGHSLGASAVSALQARDARIDAIVAWDNLSAGSTPRVPALGMSADYGLFPTPKGSDPNPQEKNAAFDAWRRAGVDAMQVNLRGAAHYEWSYSPAATFAPPASLRGIDVSAWYTTAWLDRWVKGDPSADARLLSDRWQADPADVAIDPEEGGNLFSFYYRSRAAFDAADGAPVACDDLRGGCGMLRADDGEPREPPYSYLEDRKRGR